MNCEAPRLPQVALGCNIYRACLVVRFFHALTACFDQMGQKRRVQVCLCAIRIGSTWYFVHFYFMTRSTWHAEMGATHVFFVPQKAHRHHRVVCDGFLFCHGEIVIRSMKAASKSLVTTTTSNILII